MSFLKVDNLVASLVENNHIGTLHVHVITTIDDGR